jgi:hypothetical protein
MMKVALIALVITMFLAAPAQSLAAQQTQPATTRDLVLPEGPLRITITGFEGTVQWRPSSDQKWQRVQVGQVLDEGAELRTSSRSAVQFSVGDSQIITLDRLGVVQILRANFESGKFVTDLGMKFGRTRYDIEGAGREYDAKVHSPNSVLAVRGTKVILTDQPPFAPEAVSITGRATFRDVRKQTTVGSRGGRKAKVSENTESPADFPASRRASIRAANSPAEPKANDCSNSRLPLPVEPISPTSACWRFWIRRAPDNSAARSSASCPSASSFRST